jgi:hypothetical protein
MRPFLLQGECDLPANKVVALEVDSQTAVRLAAVSKSVNWFNPARTANLMIGSRGP